MIWHNFYASLYWHMLLCIIIMCIIRIIMYTYNVCVCVCVVREIGSIVIQVTYIYNNTKNKSRIDQE